MLSLTRKTDYALVALAELAQRAGERLSARELGERCGVSLPVLRNLLKALTRVGMLESSIGADGGYRIARPASTISLMNVIEAVDGPVMTVRCCTDTSDDDACRMEHNCRIRGSIRGVHARILDILRDTTIEDLVREAPNGGHPDGQRVSLGVGAITNDPPPAVRPVSTTEI